MEQFLKRIENLLTVKSIVTLALTAVFACQAIKGEVSQDFMMIYDGHRVLLWNAGAKAAERRGCTA